MTALSNVVVPMDASPSPQQDLSAAVKERYNRRRPEREKRLNKVQEEGPLRAAGIESAIRRVTHLTVTEGRSLEAMIGGDDLTEVSFLDKGTRAARAVCRLSEEGRPMGTGFLVAPGILMTNHHVIDSTEAARAFAAEFDYQFDADDQPLRTVRFALAPEQLFVTSPADQFDFTLVAVQETSDAGTPVSSYGWLPLDPRTDKILEGEPIVIIQHPDGRTKQLCLFHSELVDRVDSYLHFTTDTAPGASGSPCFNRQWQIVALHHASVDTGEGTPGRPKLINEGVRISHILESLKDGRGVQGHRSQALKALTDPSVLRNGRPAPGNVAPGTVAVAPGTVAATPPVLARTLEKTSIRQRDASHYDGRKGYDEAFLGEDEALRVKLPQPSRALTRDLTRVQGGNDYVLRYCHFSLAVSKSRRLPIFTAVNIDGAASRNLLRTDRDPDHPQASRASYEAADTWYYDPRIAREAQLGPEIYDQTGFDYGHMVRREDPVWGDDAKTLRIANDDTFHMTNCATQHHNMNTKTWQTLENAILAAARKNKKRITVLTGPVLSVRDPEVMGIQVPTAFWKIAAWTDNGELHARGYMQWQTELVDEMRAGLESMGELEKAAEYQVPIAEIARLTSLDFGNLLDADELADGGRRQITQGSLRSLTSFWK
ncbi:MAG TPA: DNA/RNA non-specific endonuclease [Polyangia bacterium]|jgi:endonuclease G|nr:DNA/RNA non-specific endonuclease [Polyangia bacterium]